MVDNPCVVLDLSLDRVITHLLLTLLTLLLVLLLLLLLLLLLSLLLLSLPLGLLLLHGLKSLNIHVVSIHHLAVNLALHVVTHLAINLLHPHHLLELRLHLRSHLPHLVARHVLDLLSILLSQLLGHHIALLCLLMLSLRLLRLLLHKQLALHHLHHLLLLLRRHLTVNIAVINTILHGRHVLLLSNGPLMSRNLGDGRLLISRVHALVVHHHGLSHLRVLCHHVRRWAGLCHARS